MAALLAADASPTAMGRSAWTPQFWSCDFSYWPYTGRVNTEINKQFPKPYYVSFTAFPSFEPEWGLRIGGHRGHRYLGVAILLDQIWGQMMEQTVFPNSAFWDTHEFGPSVLMFRFAVSDRLATLLYTAAAQAEQNSGRFYVPGVDGITYQSHYAGGLCTETWSPQSESRAGQFVAIFRLLRKVAYKHTQAERTYLYREAIRKLQNFVKQPNQASR